uniref:alpha/beta fold hydrolase n=1 Tax=Stenotrophomonas maltophilia TaxID=40324 RepID=UPI0013DB2400
PEGFETREYLLTTEAYIETILALMVALGVERPVLAGCSMGGRIALQLAALHPDRFAGFIAIEASDYQPAWYDIDWFHRPDAHGGEMGAALV